ncbi:DUF2742 domain-containing protein [Mycolicibacterium mucogenicum]|uniref:DUF2742 domain-containing protein n=1 Tax=Mycolicibacterium mucogenicum TaxID=56689 RepID=A0A4R5W7I0_MYCMU|nr:DUF2742 domain-containing protein [Mycolicibacterium mucogenicum]
MSSREVSWWPVYQMLVGHLGKQPTVIAGTPAWHQLPNDHPDKWRAILWAAVWWALDTDTRQEQLAQASKSIAGSQEWADVRTDSRRRSQAIRSGAFIPRRSA